MPSWTDIGLVTREGARTRVRRVGYGGCRCREAPCRVIAGAEADLHEPQDWCILELYMPGTCLTLVPALIRT